MSELNELLNDMSAFIKLADGQSFTGIYKGVKRVISPFDEEKEVLELTFEVNGNDKTMISMTLARALAEKAVEEGNNLTVKKIATKGNKVTWDVTINK